MASFHRRRDVTLHLRRVLPYAVSLFAAVAVVPAAVRAQTPATDTPTPTESASATPTDSPTVSNSPVPTDTSTLTPSATVSPTPSSTFTGTPPTATPQPHPNIGFLFAASATVPENEWLCAFNLAAALGFSGGEKTFGNIAASDPNTLRNTYQVIYVAPGLTAGDYGFLQAMVVAGGVIEQFVASGGVAVINVAGSLGDQQNIAPDGVGFSAASVHDAEDIPAETHPYITGVGSGGEPLSSDDFSNWQHTDLGVLTNLPAGATTVLTNTDGGPSWVEYRHGNGRVIVTTLTYCTLSEPASQGAAARNLLRYSRFFSGSAFTPGPTQPTIPRPTATSSRSATPTQTGTPLPTATPPPSATFSATPLPTDTPVIIASATPSVTATATEAPPTPTPSETATGTDTPTPTPTTTPSTTDTPTATATATPTLACVGDCNADGQVTVDELLTMVNIALGNASVSDCLPGDGNGDGLITIDEILVAVRNALDGCPLPTATPTPQSGPFTFLRFDTSGINQADSVRQSSADVDTVQDVCVSATDSTVAETFTPTVINAVFRNESAADLELQSISIDLGPASGLGIIHRQLGGVIPGGRCAANNQHCVADGDCGQSGPCVYQDTTVDGILLFDFMTKILVIPGNTYDASITFVASDGTQAFQTDTTYSVHFDDFCNCPTGFGCAVTPSPSARASAA